MKTVLSQLWPLLALSFFMPGRPAAREVLTTLPSLGSVTDLKAIHFTDTGTGYVAGYNKSLFKTTNGGAGWNSLAAITFTTPGTVTSYDIFGMSFRTPSEGYVVGTSNRGGFFARTTDAGATWVGQANLTISGYSLSTVRFVDSSLGYIGGSSTIMKTTDGGATWAPQTVPDKAGEINDFYFFNPDTGYAVGSFSTAPSGTIVKTTNGGQNWTVQDSTHGLYGVYFVDRDSGYAVGLSGHIVKTTNGGGSWILQPGGVTGSLSDVVFTDSLTGYVTGAPSLTTRYLLKTTNGGGSWNALSTTGTGSLESMSFPSPKVGYMAGGRGLAIKLQILPPLAPNLNSPADNAINVPDSLTVTWSAVSTAIRYHLQLGTDSTFVSFLVDDSTIAGTSRIVKGLARSTAHYWRSRVSDRDGTSPWSSVRRFTTVPPVPAIPAPTLPASGATGVSVPSLLDWDSVPGAVTYRLQVSTNSGFTSLAFNDSTLISSSQSVSVLAANTLYYWRINAKNPGGTSAFSPSRSFTTLVAPPAAPVLLSPANGTVGLGPAPSPTLTWNASAGAATYRVQLSTDSLFNALLLNDSTVTTTSRAAPSLMTGTPYFWRVNAKNAGGTSAYSATWRFSTVPTALAPRDFSFLRTGDISGRVFQFGLPHRARVKIVLFDAKGNTVQNVLDEEREAGYYTLPLSAEALKGSYYLLDFRAGTYHKTFKVRL